ncbi:MAG: hypothetical protein H0V74_06520 [Chloroflexi bacterium]|nr:hypothetical protein [Chloroflexota bacterium]
MMPSAWARRNSVQLSPVRLGAGPARAIRTQPQRGSFHGVDGQLVRERVLQPKVRYAAGAMILAADDVSRVVARSAEPLLEPEVEGEIDGIVPNVIFPTALEPIDDDEAFVFYGMADSRIGVALLRRTSQVFSSGSAGSRRASRTMDPAGS